MELLWVCLSVFTIVADELRWGVTLSSKIEVPGRIEKAGGSGVS